MYIHSQIKIFIKCSWIIAVLCALNTAVNAEPYLAVKNNLPCSACHVNPVGGGARNTYGAYYGTHTLPRVAGNLALFDAGNLSETFRLGADLRANYNATRIDDGENSSGFETQSGQIYLVLQPKDSRFALYIDEQIAPGAAFNRETFVLSKLGKNHYLKAGKMMLPYGLRLEDDSAFIRQASGFNFDNSDNGVELGLQYSKALVNLAVSNGTSSQTNDDKNLQYLLRSEYLGNNWRIGASGVYNDTEIGARTQGNIFGGFNWKGFVFLAEVDHVKDESVSLIPGQYQEQRVGFLEVNKEFAKGYNLKLTTEYLDPDIHIDENHRVRHSVLLEYTPFANVQLRTGVRKGDDIPQRVNGNFLDVFAQLHFYY